MAAIDHSAQAHSFAALALRGGYASETYPQLLAILAGVHAILGVAAAISELAAVIADRFPA